MLKARIFLRQVPANARAYFQTCFSTRFQNMHSDMKLTAKDATDAKHTGKFDVSATCIQWKMSRSRIRPKIQKQKMKLDFACPSNPGSLKYTVCSMASPRCPRGTAGGK